MQAARFRSLAVLGALMAVSGCTVASKVVTGTPSGAATPSPSTTIESPQTLVQGFGPTNEGPFPHMIFNATSVYAGPATYQGKTVWYQVYAGGLNHNAANPGPVTTGGVFLFRFSSANMTNGVQVGDLNARNGTGRATIVGYTGTVLRLRTDKGATEWFDLNSLAFKYS